ncbi:MAG: HNH endonuclease [Saprospiraceae bacterium]|jgi:hypothetical protein|nr:HNH endonuclease [Saprospiraceae bacterium]MBL0025630.1 HNH endonuclease [Saprospiraceae bacterium]
MSAPKYTNLKELIYWSYSNLAMAHAGIERQHLKYGTFHYIIRAKLFKGLKDGTMNMKSIFDDEKIKLMTGQVCNYCGSTENLTLDHIIPKYKGGTDNAENLIYACTSCNSSKGKKDLMEWMQKINEYLPLMVIRRYLKLVYYHADQHDILSFTLTELAEIKIPYKPEYIPVSYPQPGLLRLTAIS